MIGMWGFSFFSEPLPILFFSLLSFFAFHHDVRGGLGVLGHGAELLCHY